MCERHGAGVGTAIQHLFGPGTALPRFEPTPPVKPTRRLKLWELEERLHCPVVGTCLKLEDIKKIARKGGFTGQDFDEYRLHVEAVSISCTRNPASEAMHKLLDRKFDLYVQRFDKARSESDVRDHWKRHLEQGEVAGAMWAALTHKAGGKDSRQTIYADVHMLSHQIGAGQAADLRRLEWLDREHGRVVEQRRVEAERHHRELAERDARIRQLERDHVEAGRRAQASSPLRARLEALESGVAMTAMARQLITARAALARHEARNGELERELAEMRERLAAQAESLDAVSRERDAMERFWVGEAAEPARTCAGECSACPGQLQGRCVLCVGGRTPLLPQYRQLAERLGVRLIHHDGGKEEALSRLPALLASSDAVICPTDCVGHLAYYQLKQHCKQANKPCVLVKSSGVASFAAALTRLAEGRAEIQPIS